MIFGIPVQWYFKMDSGGVSHFAEWGTCAVLQAKHQPQMLGVTKSLISIFPVRKTAQTV